MGNNLRMSTVEEKTVETGFGDDAFKKVVGPRKRKSDKMDEQGFQFLKLLFFK